MFDLLKASDLGIMHHTTMMHNTDNLNVFYSETPDNILAKISHLSSALDEREFELAFTKPMLPIGFKIQPDNLVTKQSGMIVKNSVTQKHLSQNLKNTVQSTQHNNQSVSEQQEISLLQQKIDLASKIASEAQNITDLLSKMQQFDSGLESQKFSANTLIYDDSSNIDILWINDSVSHDDDKNYKIMSDNAGQMIINLLDILGYGRTTEKQNGQIGCTAMSFWAVNDKNPHKEYQICLPFVKKLIYFLNPKKIILSGNIGLKYLCNVYISDNILEHHGQKKILSIDDKQFNCFATFSVSYILRSEVIKKLFWFDLLKILHDN
jgi:uracil-DNA glycosylase family 4